MNAKKAKESKAKHKDYSILRNPVITEKASDGGADKKGILVLWVDPKSDRTEIKTAVESVFNVEVEKVRTLNVAGKPKQKGRSKGFRADRKKAYITLKEGHKIQLFEGV